jgi:D-alanyl-D-alanine carboxypeptidase
MIESGIMRRATAILLGTTLVLVAAACTGDASSDTTSTSSAPAGAEADEGGLSVVEDGLGPDLSEQLEAAATESFDGISSPGAVMAVRTPEGTWTATIGHQDWERTIPTTADVHQRIGSVTKTFTVTAILQLAEQGALSLDDPIDDYVPGLPNGDATLRQLGEMRSGIPSYTFDESFQDTLFSDPEHQWTPQQLVDLVKGDEPMFAPGEMMFYSNTNLVLLGMVIEQVTGSTVESVMVEQIFEPLGLEHTNLPSDSAYPEPHWQGYTLQGVDGDTPQDATAWDPSWGWTAGAMISDIDDMLVWGRALATGEDILSPESQAMRLDSFDFDVPMFAGPDRTAPQTPARAYGLGLGLALDWYGHEGELPGFNTYVQHHLPDDVTVVVMVNSDISSGECPSDTPTVPDGRTSGPCDTPSSHVADALADVLGLPLVEPTDTTTTTTAG